MPRQRDGLADYQDWLVYEFGLRASTAKVYTSFVRAVVKALGPNMGDQAVVRAHFLDLWENDPTRYANTTRPWELFREWAEGKGVVVPDPGKPPRRREADSDEPGVLPADVLHVVHELGSRRLVPMTLIPFLVWGDVRQHGRGLYHLRDPRQRATWIQLDVELVNVLRNFASPSDESAPLIPSEPGGRQAAPVQLIQKEVRAFRRATEKDPEILRAIYDANRRADDSTSALPQETPLPEPADLPDEVTAETYKGFELPSHGTMGLDLKSAMAFNPDED